MATYTSNLDLKKPAQSDKIRIADINNNMDTIDSTIGAIGTRSVTEQLTDIEGSIAIVSTGNVHVAISAGQYVYIKGHDTLSDGLYTADSALAANATLSSSNVTAVSGGGLNSLSNHIANIGSYLYENINKSVSANTWTTTKSISLTAGTWLVISYMDLNVSVSGIYNNRLSALSTNQVVRNVGTNGGGCVNARVYTSNASFTVDADAYVESNVTVRGILQAIRLNA